MLQVEIDDVAPALHTRSKHEGNVYAENVSNFGDDVLLYTAVDDPEYVEFISNLNDPSKYDLDGIFSSFVKFFILSVKVLAAQCLYFCLYFFLFIFI